jgi:hypothetical protein
MNTNLHMLFAVYTLHSNVASIVRYYRTVLCSQNGLRCHVLYIVILASSCGAVLFCARASVVLHGTSCKRSRAAVYIDNTARQHAIITLIIKCTVNTTTVLLLQVATFSSNPKFGLDITDDAAEVFVSLAVPDARLTHGCDHWNTPLQQTPLSIDIVAEDQLMLPYDKRHIIASSDTKQASHL